MRNLQYTFVVLVLAALGGCTVEPPEPGAPVAIPAAPAPDAPVDGCPVPAPDADGPTLSRVAIDYVDFINHDGRRYLTGSDEAA